MRIFSKRQDFYDGVLVSPDPVWERHEKSFKYGVDNFYQNKNNADITNEENEFLHSMWSLAPFIESVDTYCVDFKKGINTDTFIPYDFILFGYCGKIYPVYLLLDGDKNPIKSFKTPQEWIKSANEIYPRKNKSERRRYLGCSTFTRHPPYFNKDKDISKKEWHDVYTNSTKAYDLFLKFNTPIFIITKDEIIINPCLKDRKLTNIMDDSWTFAQGIEQFLSNDLVSQINPDCILDDVGKRDAHGFDIMSFKNTSTKKPRRKMRRK